MGEIKMPRLVGAKNGSSGGLMHGWKLTNVEDLRVGDSIRIVCDEIVKIFRKDKNRVHGTIISLFDASGKKGSWWQVEVRLDDGGWWMYEPQRYLGLVYTVDKTNGEQWR
jgi:hypothetical protein